MSPADIDRVFGRGRLRMVTGDHVEVFREEALPGERRRYTKRFLTTAAGDFRHWTEREWRILARLVGHGVGPVPDVVQFDRGARDRPALVQTYDAGITVDHWATLLPVARDGTLLRHVFEDCAHWWALAHHALIALDAIHALQLVHLDLKADNVCIPSGPADFDPLATGQLLQPRFEQIALIDFAFSLVSGESLVNALPIARQADYDYQSPRLLHALEAGRRGDLLPTRQLDWRCDIFSLGAMLRRYLPDAEAPLHSGWTPMRQEQARVLMQRLFEAHDGAARPLQRPHAELIALTSAPLDDEELAASLHRGWMIVVGPELRGQTQPTAVTRIALPTPVTRIALPLRDQGATAISASRALSVQAPSALFIAMPSAPSDAAPSAPLSIAMSDAPPIEALSAQPIAEPIATPTPLHADQDVIAIDPADVASRARAMPPRRRDVGRKTVWFAASAAAAVLAVPLLGEAWLALRGSEAAAEKSVPAPAVAVQGPVSAEPAVIVMAAPREIAKEVAATKETEGAPSDASSASAGSASAASAGIASVAAAPAAVTPAAHPRRDAKGSAHAATVVPPAILAHGMRRAASEPGYAATHQSGPTPTRPAVTAGLARARNPLHSKPLVGAPAVRLAQSVPARSPTRPATAALHAGALSATVGPQASERLAPAAASLPTSRVMSGGSASIATADDLPAPAPRDFNARAEDVIAHHLPRIAQRAERLVLRVLFVAATADMPMQEAEIRSAASAIRLAPGDPSLDGMAEVDDARLLTDAARHAFFRRGNAREALALQTKAFGANPQNPEVVGNLAFLHLKQQPAEADPARRLALHALTMNDSRYPNGRLEDWTTLAIASALLGRERDARNAWLVTVALAPDLERQCRAAINAYAMYGERLRAPVEAMLYRAQATGRAERSASCEWPPHWSASNQVR